MSADPGRPGGIPGEGGRAGALYLVPIYCGPRAALLDPLARRLEALFGLPVERHRPTFDPEVAFDPSRSQYNSRVLLGALLQQAPPEAARILGVAGVDLFIPVLTYVFGEAQLAGRAAVVSMYRLDPELYGLPADPARLLGRLCREAIHELGHTFDLVHCARDTCVMSSSTYVELIDTKEDRFCPSCARALRASA